jgi:endoglucanase
MRNVSSLELVKEMHLGWNLGNTLDAPDGETKWGNPKTTQAMMDAVKAAGFNTVRIPVTWQKHMGGAPEYLVDPVWMDRVEEVTNYVLSTGMYAIVNTHHDEWVSVMPTADQAAITDQLVKLWTQIATRFKNYDEQLVFETLNEPRTKDNTEWTGGTPAARAIINAYNLSAVNAIRGTGGNNAQRHIMIPTHAANASATSIRDLVIPNNDPNIIVSLHTYYPYDVSMGTGTTWGTDVEKADMIAELERLATALPKKGRAAIIGEWGTTDKGNTAVRVEHARTYAREARARGFCAIWWDNGFAGKADGFGILNRKVSPVSWLFPEIRDALVAGASEGAASAP